jgi:hypothetical protein
MQPSSDEQERRRERLLTLFLEVDRLPEQERKRLIAKLEALINSLVRKRAA